MLVGFARPFTFGARATSMSRDRLGVALFFVSVAAALARTTMTRFQPASYTIVENER